MVKGHDQKKKNPVENYLAILHKTGVNQLVCCITRQDPLRKSLLELKSLMNFLSLRNPYTFPCFIFVLAAKSLRVKLNTSSRFCIFTSLLLPVVLKIR